VGAVVGGVAGGLAGKGAAEAVNPTVEMPYWRDNYSKRPYVTAGSRYDTYRPAYQYGWESELSRNWDSNKGKLSWDRAREAARDAWHRVEKAMPGDAEKDGY